MAKLSAIDISTSEPWVNVAISGKTAWLSPSPTQTQPNVRIDRFGNSAYVSGTSFNDHIEISVDPDTGEIVITIETFNDDGDSIGSTSYRLPPGTQVTINAGAGNGTVFVPPGTHISLRVLGGAGDDKIDARGTSGTGQYFGGTGNDRVEAGRDDTVHAETWVVIEYDPNLGSYINVVGSPEFIARVQSDLDFMRSDTEGQHLLQQLEDDYNNSRIGLTIQEISDDSGHADPSFNDYSPYVVRYNPNWNFNYDPDGDDTTYVPPIIVLYHELGHIYQFGSGTAAGGEYTSYDFNGVRENYPTPRRNLEPQNVGLPYDKNGDGVINSEDAVLPDLTGHDPRITENNMRAHLGYQPRLVY